MKRSCLVTWLAALMALGCGSDPTATGQESTDTEGSTGEASSTGDCEGECSEGESTGANETDDDPGPEPEYLDDDALLVRISMALRGTRPSAEDLQAVRDDPSVLPNLVDAYMAGPGFAETVRDLHNDALHTNVEGQFPSFAPLEDVAGFAISQSIMNTSLRLAEAIVLEDRPYSELVTADTWVIDDVVAAVYGIDAPGSGWREIPMPSDRPAAGVLSDNAFFLRHESAGANHNRGRANAVTTALLCLDYEDTNIELDDGVDLTDPAALADALSNNPSCMACHETLDPIASHFFPYPGNVMNGDITGYPVPDLYRPEGEDAWMNTNGRAPEYFGQETGDIGALGAAIAEDSRFTACAARRFYAYFTRTRLEDVPQETVEVLQAAFEADDLRARTLIREVVLSDAFRIAAASDEADADDVHGYLRARPFQLARLVEDLTGYRWELDLELVAPGQGAGIVDLARSSTIGFQVLGGSGDSFTVFESIDTTNATTALFQRQLAAEAASYVVEHDAGADEPRLLRDGLVTEEGAVRAQLAVLFDRIYGEAVLPDAASVDDGWALFSAVFEASNDPARAWKATLTAMLRDMDVLFY